MQPYTKLMADVLRNGVHRIDRTGIGTTALFGQMLRFDLRDGFPAVTTKRLGFGQVVAELACFLRGYENLSDFRQAGCTIWDANATAPYWLRNPNNRGDGDLGRIYGAQWRAWRCPDGSARDQLAEAVRLLHEDPSSRRILVTAWNPGELDAVCLPPCHVMFQFFVDDSNNLDCMVVMRSVDVFIGMPFDIASYALLMHIVAQQVGMTPRMLTMIFGDCHIYNNHSDQCLEQLQRRARDLPYLYLEEATTIDNFTPWMAVLKDYDPHPPIKAQMNI